jgi:adenylate cyclase
MPGPRHVRTGDSKDRLDELIASRLEPGADKERIDQRIWDLFGEEWCVMFTDLSGFSRNVARFGIIHFLQTIHESERLLIPVIDAMDGILLKIEGDSFLVMFRNPQKGLQAAVTMQRTLAGYNADKADEEKVLLCVGLGFGKVLRIGDIDVFGHEVNSASKLGEDTAKAGEILVTGDFRDKVGAADGLSFEELPVACLASGKAFRVRY